MVAVACFLPGRAKDLSAPRYEFLEEADNILFVPFVFTLKYVPTKKVQEMTAHKLKLKLHIVFEEQVSGAIQVWRILQCHNILILELEYWLPSGSTQQLQGLDIVHTSVLTCTKNPIQELHQEVSLSASTVQVVSKRLLPLSMQTTNREHWSMNLMFV